MWLALLWIVTANGTQFEEARAREEAQDDAGAIAIWEAEVKANPTSALPRVELGRLLLKSGERVELAAFHLEMACSLSPKNPRAHYLYALAAEERKDVAHARQALETALGLRDDYDEARYRLAGLLFAEGDFGGAAEAYRRFVDRHPDDTGARLQLALAYERSGKVDLAERLLRGLEKEPTTRGLGRRRLAELLERHGRVAEAAKLRAKDAPPRRLRELRPSRR